MRLSKEQVEDLLIYCNTTPTFWKQEDCLVCCPVHGESHPSMGVSLEKQVCHCFSCNFAGDFTKLLMYSLPEEFGLDKDNPNTFSKAYARASEFIATRYELEYRELGHKVRRIKRYKEESKHIELDDRKTIPLFKIAPYQSGKETYKYFFDRGFTKEDMQKFKVGRDLDNKTVTLPVFYEDNTLAGVIGRYISKHRLKNQRYKIYDNFERSSILYPLNLSKVIEGVAILVEGQFDVMRMHQFGYENTFALMTNNLSWKQSEWLCKNCHTVIWIGDNDDRGIESREKARKKLKGKVVFKTVDYPEYGKDVCDWSKEDIDTMINSARSILGRKIKRL